MSYTDQRIAKDRRRDVAICQYYITDSNTFELRNSTDYTVGKWRRHWMPEEANVGDKTSVNWVMLRYSDVLLMAAEAEFYLYGDNAPLGVEYLNEVRFRGYSSRGFSVRVKNEDLRPDVYSPDGKAHYAVIRERMLELGHEGLRKYDLIRWGLYAEYLNKMRDEMGTFSNGLDPYRTYQERDVEANQDVDVNYAWPPYINSLYGTPSTSAEMLISSIAVGRENSSVLLARTMATFGEEKISIVARDFKKLKHELYPVPSAELLTNPKLKQCPAY
jgi:hypothetical protein